jgi:uncharacterized protein DUF3500
VSDESAAASMRAAAVHLLYHLGDKRSGGQLPFTDETARRWIEYRPRPRPGVCLADLDPASHKAALQLLATALSTHAFAQAVTVMAVEEVLDRAEGGHRGRHMNDYWVAVFGEPVTDGRWGWRFEGHHLSVTMTLAGDAVSPAPLFLGLNPATTRYRGEPVLRPLALEEELARALLVGMGKAERDAAVVADTAPTDILSGTRPRVPERTEPLGVPVGRLDTASRALFDRLLGGYLDRLVPELAGLEFARLEGEDLYFAWAGSPEPGQGHYYRVQGPDLLVEYDNTQNGANHAHTVLRKPLTDFGDDILAAHYAAGA